MVFNGSQFYLGKETRVPEENHRIKTDNNCLTCCQTKVKAMEKEVLNLTQQLVSRSQFCGNCCVLRSFIT